MSVTVNCYDGVGTIGGNKILLEDLEQDSRVFLDFGMNFKVRGKYFEEYLKPRPGRGLRDPLRMELIPPLEGIYREDMITDEVHSDLAAMAGPEGPRSVEVDGVFISHAHLDHIGYVTFLRGDLPIYATAMTAAIAKVLQDMAQGTEFEREICFLSPRRIEEDGLLRADRAEPFRGRPYVILDDPGFAEHPYWLSSPTRKRFQASPADAVQAASGDGAGRARVGALSLRSYPVDHSLFGAAGCAVETSEGWIAYTGDIRLHGKRGHLTRSFAEKMAALEPAALLCEGTRLDSDERVAEDEVQEAAEEAVREASGLVIADFTARNIERLLTFHEIAAATARTLAITPGDAFLLEKMRLVDPELPDLENSRRVKVFADVKSQPRRWEVEVRSRARRRNQLIESSDVASDPSQFLLCMSFYDINDLIDLAPSGADRRRQPWATYIYSSTEAFNEEMAIDLDRLRNWLSHFSVKLVGDPDDPDTGTRLHASGHASAPDLIEVVQTIRPERLIPIHSEIPERYVDALQGTGIEVVLPERGVPITL
ncbi:MAG: MBL fold metallo-hydrolase RNA specificity domain-containing protein [Anaerolineae bacterium]